MANFVNIELDLTAPTLVGIALGSVERTASTTGHAVSFTVSGGSDVNEYKIWSPDGDLFGEATLETVASWIAFTTKGIANNVNVTLASGDGTKTAYAMVRDDVGNPSGAANDSFVLDQTGPSLTAISINNGHEKTGSTAVSVSFTVNPSDMYLTSVLLWGDLANGETTKAAAETGTGWVNFTTMGSANNQNAGLSSGDGDKTIYAIVRDDLNNESAQRSDSIELDQTAPVIMIYSQPNPGKISKIAGFDSSVFTWYWEAVGTDVGETGAYQVEVGGSGKGTGTILPTAAGSTHVTGVVSAAGTGSTTSSYNDTGKHVTTTVKGTDLDSAKPGNGSKKLNVYVTDSESNVTPYQP